MEEIIKKINANGYHINNLFQLDPGYWRCNLRDNESECFFNFAEGKTPKEALVKALAKTEEKPVKREEDFSDILG